MLGSMGEGWGFGLEGPSLGVVVTERFVQALDTLPERQGANMMRTLGL